MRKKRIWKSLVVLLLVTAAGTAGIRGISAFFTDTQEKANTMTVGNVQTEIEESEWGKTPDEDKEKGEICHRKVAVRL